MHSGIAGVCLDLPASTGHKGSQRHIRPTLRVSNGTENSSRAFVTLTRTVVLKPRSKYRARRGNNNTSNAIIIYLLLNLRSS